MGVFRLLGLSATRGRAVNYKATIMALCAAISAPVFADKPVYLNLGGPSYHFSDREFNEKNYGLGIEAPIGGLLVGAGVYDNSIGKVSRYVVAEKCMLPIGRACLGAMAGFVDGYYLNDGGFIPMAAPTLTAEVGRLGMRIIYVPAVDDRVAAVVAMQFRVKIGSL